MGIYEAIDADNRPAIVAIKKRMPSLGAYDYGLVCACIELLMPFKELTEGERADWEEFILKNDAGFKDSPGNLFGQAGWDDIKKEITNALTIQDLKNIYYKHTDLQKRPEFLEKLRKQKIQIIRSSKKSYIK